MPIALPNILDLLYSILKIQNQVTGDFQHDFLFLIFFPHVIIIIWLYFVARAPSFMARHQGMGTLLALAIYIFIVYNGWYATIANLAIIWLGITIVVSFFYFMLPKFFHPGAGEERFKVGKAIGDKLFSRREIDKKIHDLVVLKAEAQQKWNNANNDRDRQVWTQAMKEYEEEIKELERKKRWF